MARYRTLCCDEVLESTHRHDFVTCSCGASSVDGGDEYSRVLWKPEVSSPPQPIDQPKEED